MKRPPSLADAPARRSHCTACGRPQSTCLCAWVRPVAAGMPDVEVLILQHPMEVAQAKGTARLLHLSLAGSRVMVGERFEPDGLAEALSGPRRNLLLYPDDGPCDASPGSSAAGGVRLVVIDGTWRKSRKMLHLNPALQALPRLALQNLPPSRYAIRKAHRADQLSTLEAACAALAQLQGEPRRFDALLAAFDGFIAQQASRRSGGSMAGPPPADQSPRSMMPASETSGGAS